MTSPRSVLKSAKEVASAAAAPKAPRKPSRRYNKSHTASGELISRDLIIDYGLDLTRTMPLASVSVLKVAQTMGVTAGLLHYYLTNDDAGARAKLTSGIMNRFFLRMYEAWPKDKPGDNWRVRYAAIVKTTFKMMSEYPGVALYIAANEQFRLIQSVEPGEADYGIILYDRYIAALMASGLKPKDVAFYGSIVQEFITASALSARYNPWSEDHRARLRAKVKGVGAGELPALRACMMSFKPSPTRMLQVGLDWLLDGIDAEIKKSKKAARATAASAATTKNKAPVVVKASPMRRAKQDSPKS